MLKPAPDRSLEDQTPTPRNGPSNATLGIGLLVLAEVVFAALDAAAKFMGKEMPIPMVVWGRYLFNLILLLALFRGPKLRRALIVTRPWMTTIRGVLLMSMTFVFFTAIQYIPLADAVAIGFVAPLCLFRAAVIFPRCTRGCCAEKLQPPGTCPRPHWGHRHSHSLSGVVSCPACTQS